jgi:osmotically-inducible protein OsmY
MPRAASARGFYKASEIRTQSPRIRDGAQMPGCGMRSAMGTGMTLADTLAGTRHQGVTQQGASHVGDGPAGTAAAGSLVRSSAASGRDRSHGQQDRNLVINREGESMKTIQFLKAAGSIACVAFALNATAQTTASAPPATSESVGQHIDDGTVTTKVKAELLGAKNVKSTHIHVKTRKGIVWLTGSVPSAEDKTSAQDVVQNVSGVKGVKNHLKVAAD